jgi:hypothetical protein
MGLHYGDWLYGGQRELAVVPGVGVGLGGKRPRAVANAAVLRTAYVHT